MDENTSRYQSYFTVLAKATTDIVVCLEQNFLITALNPAAEDFYQCSTKKTAGSSYFYFSSPHHQEPIFSKKDFDKLTFKKPALTKTDSVNAHYIFLWSVTRLFDKNKQTIGYLITAKEVAAQNCFTSSYAERNAFLNNLIRSLPAHFYLKNKKGVYLGSNDLNAQAAGFKNAAELLGKTDYEAAWRKEAAAIRQNDSDVISKGAATIVEETGTIQNGNLVTAITHKVPLRDEKDEVMGVLGISVDITSYLKKEQASESKNKSLSTKDVEIEIYLGNLVSNLPDNIYWCDVNGVYKGCNKQQAASFGLKKEEDFIGKTLYELVEDLSWDKSLVDTIYNNDQWVMKTGKTLMKEEVVIGINGKKRTYFSRKIPIMDSRGDCIGLFGISTDITALKEKEKKIKKAREISEQKSTETELYLENLIANLPDNIYWCDRSGVYKGCNSQQTAMLGLKKDELIGKTVYDAAKILHWDKNLADVIYKNDQEVMRTGEALAKEEEVVWIDGQKRTYLSRKIPATDSKGNCIGLLGISTDITPLKEVESSLREAKELSEMLSHAKTEFIANMSHDVKTPLAGIISISEALSSRIPQECRELTQDILQAGQYLMTFFENCIELSKLEGGSIALSKETFSLKRLVNEIAHLFRPAIKAKGLELHVDYDENIPKRLLGGRVTLYRSLLNLMGNAVKFTSQGSVTIRVQLSENSTPEKAVIKLVVVDTGIGIPPDKQKVIFERFSRVTPTYQGTFEGSGIGLYIVEEFVKAMGGEIHVRSMEGKGSQFTIIVPLQIPLLAEAEYDDVIDFSLPLQYVNLAQLKPSFDKSIFLSAHAVESIADTATSQIKVLLVEDNLMAQKGAKLLFSSLGCKMDVAARGKEAIALFKPGQYDLVLMDVGLPDMKGYDVAKYFRKMEEGTSFSVPILGLSAHATQDEKQLSESAGIAEMLSKPLLEEQAREALMKYVTVVRDTINEKLLATEDGVRVIDLQKRSGDSNAKEQMAWEILDDLIVSLPEVHAEIEAAYKARDIPLLIAKLHKLHGGLCYTKATHLLEAVTVLEISLKNGEHDKLDVLYTNVLKAMETLEAVYQSL
jgi:two-component system aerobic respiration control sensor histidine kinase ArcB